MRFMLREVEPQLERALTTLAAFVGADAEDMALVQRRHRTAGRRPWLESIGGWARWLRR
jgi:hypothetical protein